MFFFLFQQGFVDFYSRRPNSAEDESPWDGAKVIKYGVLAIGAVALGALLTQRTWRPGGVAFSHVTVQWAWPALVTSHWVEQPKGGGHKRQAFGPLSQIAFVLNLCFAEGLDSVICVQQFIVVEADLLAGWQQMGGWKLQDVWKGGGVDAALTNLVTSWCWGDNFDFKLISWNVK